MPPITTLHLTLTFPSPQASGLASTLEAQCRALATYLAGLARVQDDPQEPAEARVLGTYTIEQVPGFPLVVTIEAGASPSPKPLPQP